MLKRTLDEFILEWVKGRKERENKMGEEGARGANDIRIEDGTGRES